MTDEKTIIVPTEVIKKILKTIPRKNIRLGIHFEHLNGKMWAVGMDNYSMCALRCEAVLGFCAAYIPENSKTTLMPPKRVPSYKNEQYVVIKKINNCWQDQTGAVWTEAEEIYPDWTHDLTSLTLLPVKEFVMVLGNKNDTVYNLLNEDKALRIHFNEDKNKILLVPGDLRQAFVFFPAFIESATKYE